MKAKIYLVNFLHYDTLEINEFNPDNYKLAYEYQPKEKETFDILEECFTVFTMLHPSDYKYRSLSVGDVVVLSNGSIEHAYVFKAIGWESIGILKA